MKVISLFFLALVCLGSYCEVGYAQQHQGPDNGRLLELYQTQQYRQAASYLLSFYTDSIADPAVLGRLGYCYRMAGDYLRAEHYYLKLYTQDTLNVPILLALAGINVQRGLHKSAADFYQRVIQLDSTRASAFDALADLMRRRGDLKMAFRYLERANGLQPENSVLAYDFAKMCIEFEQYGKADTVLDVALQADSLDGMLLLGKMQVAERLKKYMAMVTFGERLVHLGDESQQVLTLLARGYFHSNDFKGCKETYEHLLAIFPELGELDYYYLAMSLKAMKRYKEGLDIMDKVLKLAISPNTAFYYGRKADLHDLANEPSAAAVSFLRSMQFEEIPLHYYSLAVIYDRKLNDTRNALRHYQRYLKMNPPEEERIYIDYVKKRVEELKRL